MNVACGNCLYFENLLRGNGNCLKTGERQNMLNHCREWRKKK